MPLSQAKKAYSLITALTLLVLAAWVFWGERPALQLSPWFQAMGPVLTNPSLLPDGTVVFGASDMVVYALDKGGVEKWRFSLAKSLGIPSSAAIGADGTIYFGASDSNVYVLNSNGIRKLSVSTGGPIRAGTSLDEPFAVLVCSDDGNVYSFATNGLLRWKYLIGTNFYCAPVVDKNGNLYVGSLGSNVFAFGRSGVKHWEFPTGPFITGMALSEETILAACADKNLYAIRHDGTQKWKFQAKAALGGGIAVGFDGTTYIGGMDGILYALTPSGAKLWEFDAHAPVEAGILLGADGSIYCHAGNCLIKLRANGVKERMWTLGRSNRGDSYHPSSPAIDPWANLWVGSWDCGMYRISVGDIASNAPWPMAGQNNRRTGRFPLSESKGASP